MRDLVFAVTWQRKSEPIGERFVTFSRWLGSKLGCRVTPKVALSYEELLSGMRESANDIAWLPPLIKSVLESEQKARTLLVSERGGRDVFHCIIACRADSNIESLEQLQAARAAWVDPWSASGYVMPRLYMHERGIRWSRAILEERFLGSHDAAVRRLIDGHADITATYGNLDADGHITSAGWRSIPEAREQLRLLTSVGVIPSDAIATSVGMSDEDRAKISAALSSDDPEAKRIMRDALDVSAFRAPSQSDDFLMRSMQRSDAKALFPHLYP